MRLGLSKFRAALSNLVANSHRAAEVQVLLQVNRARTRKHSAQQTTDERATAGQGLALQNIRQRLQARYDDAAQLRVTPGAQGCVAELSLPYSTANAGQ